MLVPFHGVYWNATTESASVGSVAVTLLHFVDNLFETT